MQLKRCLVICLLAFPLMTAAALAAPSATRDDVLKAYTAAQQSADRSYSRAWNPIYNAEDKALKEVDDKETKAIWAARGHLKNLVADPDAALKSARKNAYAAADLADAQAEAKYQETVAEARAKGRAELTEAERRFQSMGTVADVLNSTIANTTAVNSAVETALNASNASIEAARTALVRESDRVNSAYGEAAREADTVRYNAKWNSKHVAEIATKPMEDMLAIAKEADHVADYAAIKPAIAPFKDEAARIKADFEKADAPLKKAHQRAFVKRVRIWSQYDSGKISAEIAVRELNALSKTQE